jgi:hypothetical protein
MVPMLRKQRRNYLPELSFVPTEVSRCPSTTQRTCTGASLSALLHRRVGPNPEEATDQRTLVRRRWIKNKSTTTVSTPLMTRIMVTLST